MSDFAVDWLNLLFRWAHMVVGIGWIGTSFYFIALDLSLRKREGMREGVYGTAWEVHGGGFYQVEKYLVAPATLPPDLLWYRWEAYLTWVTGFALLILQYYWHADVFLIDKSVLPMLPIQAIFFSVVSLALGWLIYDRLCKSAIGSSTVILGMAVFVLIVAAAWVFTHIFSGRGALIHVGAFIGTIMAFNVFGIIVPNQRKIVASLIAGEAPDPRLGAVGKQRSVHNNYLTLPVLLMMVSNHYPMLTSHPQPWLVVALIIIVGAAVRHFLNRHDAGDHFQTIGWALGVAAVALGLAIWLTAPRSDPAMAGLTVSDAEVLAIVDKHCVMCHAAHPTHTGFDEPPKGVVLTSIDEIRRHAAQIMVQAVNGTTMPLGNEMGMTVDERRQLGAFLEPIEGRPTAPENPADMADFPISLHDVNALDEDEFVDAFGDVAEHAPWVAAEAGDRRPFHSRDAMVKAFADAVKHADHARQRALLLAHPDLAGRAAIAGDLTHASKAEQAGAGLDKLTPDEFHRFTEMNTRYRDRHGIPFIFAVRGATKHDILAGFAARVDNDPGVEFNTALEQVAKIIRFRLEDRVLA